MLAAAPLQPEALLPAYLRAAGGVRLRVSTTAGRSHRAEVAESGGYRVRFPERHDGVCESVLINTGGGMAGGDRMTIELSLDPGAVAVVSTQAAEKIYRSQGPATRVGTRLVVGAGAALAFLPQETILFSGSRLARDLAIDLAEDARLVACESLVFGRAAMGEALLAGALHDRWRVRRAGRLVFAEDARLDGEIARILERPALGGGARAVATILRQGPDGEGMREAVRGLLAGEPAVEAGAGLIDGILVVRLLARDAAQLRRVVVILLGHLTERALPRTWST